MLPAILTQQINIKANNIFLIFVLIFSFNIELEFVSINATVRLSCLPPFAIPSSSTRITILSTAPPKEEVPPQYQSTSVPETFPIFHLYTA